MNTAENTPLNGEIVEVTQVANPARATTRTVLQNVLGALVGFGLLAPFILQWLVDGLNSLGMAEQAAFVATALGGTVAVAALLARVMAIPGVEAWLQQSQAFRWLAAAKRPDIDQGPGDLGFNAEESGYNAMDLDLDERLTIDGHPDSEPSSDAIIYQEDGELPEPELQDEDGPQHRAEDKGN